MLKSNARTRGAGLALVACGMALAITVLLAQRPQDCPRPAAASREEARACLVESDPLPPLI